MRRNWFREDFYLASSNEDKLRQSSATDFASVVSSSIAVLPESYEPKLQALIVIAGILSTTKITQGDFT